MVLVSIAAGVASAAIRAATGHRGPIVRAMPNTPALVGKSATALYADQLPDEHRPLLEDFFSKIGIYHWVENEQQLHAITAVSGSGPAYLFYLLAAWEKAAIEMGLDRALAHSFIVQSVIGAITLSQEKKQSWEALIAQVASRGGTTEAALQHLDNTSVDTHVLEALTKAYERSVALERSHSKQ